MIDHVFLTASNTHRAMAFYGALAIGAAEIHASGPQLHYDLRFYTAPIRDMDGCTLECVYKSWQHGG
ncbi:hypothetical protein [Paraburkholderia azotifigens]|uniref:VOC family protein n=1 Tax=Paraburkholderia azotifigens TaxID=2057004 RepID=A0A5C6V3J1_9BURK|nr:hypothetical protein [Paraburkholderia azotifigens]TXC79797.1 hypothetical protein FRZ40_36320 [Paraburkholderia azotifigens]